MQINVGKFSQWAPFTTGEGQKIPRTSLGKKRLMFSDLVKIISQEHLPGVFWWAFRFWRLL